MSRGKALPEDRATFEGHAMDARFRSTQVFVRQDGGWQHATGHTTAADER